MEQARARNSSGSMLYDLCVEATFSDKKAASCRYLPLLSLLPLTPLLSSAPHPSSLSLNILCSLPTPPSTSFNVLPSLANSPSLSLEPSPSFAMSLSSSL
jgi:hypothetical protein